MTIFQKYRNPLGVGIIVLLVAGILTGAYFRNRTTPEFMEFTTFMQHLNEGNIESVSLSDGANFVFSMVDYETEFTTNNPRRVDFKETLLLSGVLVTERASSIDNLMQIAFMAALAVGVLFFVSKRGTSPMKSEFCTAPVNALASGENPAKTCGFDDIAGNLEAKENVQDIVDYLKDPEKYARYGARMPRGILLHGKPGTGKTLMARAMAGEAGVPFYAVSGSDFVQMYVGVGASRVRELFKKAREIGKGVIFIDEIDALGKKRSEGPGGNDEREQTLNALLTEMQGFSDKSGIVVIAATNRPDTLDEALLRPGRFDRRVEIALPDINARKQILTLHAKNKPLAQDISLEKLAEDTVFFSGAMLEGLLNDSAINAARRGAEEINLTDITSAYYTAVAGNEKKDRSAIRDHERTITAYHEAGHALVAHLVNPENRVAKVTIIPSSSGVGGFCVNIPPERMFWSKAEIRGQIMVNLAGRCAEEVKFGEDNVTTGAANDIEKATNTTMQYITTYGMGSQIIDRSKLNDTQQINKECASLAKKLYNQTLELLQENRIKLETLAQELLKKETLESAEIEAILA